MTEMLVGKQHHRFILFSKLTISKMSKWDDQFDFDDFDAKPAPKKPKDNIKPKKQQDDFFDLEEQAPSNSNKLPSINPKPIAPIAKQPNHKNSKNLYDDYEEIYEEVDEARSPLKSISKKEAQQSNYYEELEEIQDLQPVKQNLSLPKVANKQSKANEDEQFYESVEEIKPPPRESKKLSPFSSKKPVPAENTIESPKKVQEPQEQIEDYDDYGQDFQQQVKQTKVAPKKSQTSANLMTKDKKQRENSADKKKYGINANQIFTNKAQKEVKTQPSVPKPQPKATNPDSRNNSKKVIEAKVAHTSGVSVPPKSIQKSHSRKSLKSNDSRVGVNSRVTKKYTTQFTSNKHMLLVEKNFPEDEQKLNSMTIDKLSRVNENIRDMIRKFNQELNELINKNMILLKDKPLQKERKIQQRIRVLEEQLKSGATALEVVENEYERLKGREGELKEEEYLLIMEKKIEEVKEQTKETSKAITKLKYEVNNEGNKLSRQDVERKMAQELHQIKTMLIQLKKQEEKNEAKNEKLTRMLEELEGKNNDKEYELSEQIDTAKEKGIQINVKEAMLRKYEELKLKVANSENHGRALEGLHKSKCDVVTHQKDQIRIAIRNIQSQIKNLMHTIERAQEQSIKTIKKAQENPKLSQEMIQSLDKLLKSIEENQNNSYFDIRTQGNKSQASQRPLKKSMYENLHKEKPSRNSASKKESPSPKPEPQHDEINLLKPNFMKKKEKPLKTEEEETNNLYEKMWQEEEEERKRQEQNKKEQQRKIQQEKKLAEQQSKKKPFMLKKNRLNNAEQRSFEQTPETKKAEEPLSLKLESPPAAVELKQEEQKPAIKPKFTRFNKRGTDRQVDLSIEQPATEAPQSGKAIEEPPKEQFVDAKKEEDAPIFMPKRFNLRNKLEKKEDTYIPSVEKVQQKKQQIKEYSPTVAPIITKEQQPYKISQPKPKPIQQQTKAEQAAQKPRLMLRLRDRQKKESNDDQVPTRLTEVDDRSQREKVGYSPSTKENRNEDSYVPTFKRPEKDFSSNPSIPKENIISPKDNFISPKENINESLSKESINNPYAPKQIGSYPFAPPVQEEKTSINNPYAQLDNAPKKEREGPVKKIKIQNKAPKEKFNIYQQAEDLTEPAPQTNSVAVNEPVSQKPQYNGNLAKTDELDLNAMLGIKKKEKANDFDDLLGDVKVDKKKEKKKNTDFFNDLAF